MNRSIIFDFLCNKRDLLNRYGYAFMTISMLGRFEVNDISNLFVKRDEVVIFHIKEPRIYQKEYQFSEYEKTIADMLMYNKEPIYLKKTDFSEEIKDPFYLKDIRNLQFTSLWLLPITQENEEDHQIEIVGSIIIYFNQEAKDFSISNGDIRKLYKNLQKYEGQRIEKDIEDNLLLKEDYIKIVYQKDLKFCYIDDEIKTKLRWKKNIIDLDWNKKIAIKLKREIKSFGFRSFENDLMIVYYLSRHEYKLLPKEKDALALGIINKHGLSKFTMILVGKNNIDDCMFNVFPSSMIKKYYVNEQFVVYLLDEDIDSEKEKELKSEVSDDYLLILPSTKIGSKMNLVSFVEYVEEIKPDTFNFEDYNKYVSNLNKMKLYTDIDFMEKGEIKNFVNAVTKDHYGILPKIIDTDLSKFTGQMNFARSINYLIDSLIVQIKSDYIVPLIPSILINRKIFQKFTSLKEISEKQKVLLLNPYPILDQESINNLEKGLVKLKNIGLTIIVDSSIYFNYRTTHLLELADGVYIRHDEFESLVNHPAGINSAIFDYMYKNYKELIIDYPLDKVNDAYINRLFNYLSK